MALKDLETTQLQKSHDLQVKLYKESQDSIENLKELIQQSPSQINVEKMESRLIEVEAGSETVMD